MTSVRKPLCLKNCTKFFVPDKDKVSIRTISPDSFQFRKQKIEGYETRLYWQYKYCESVGGQTFFYTLTYNNKNLPVKYGCPCFDYEDLRDLFTGGFRKMLLRKYGTSFKYFVGAELGEGKGARGFHNNPHYHILFFLEPSPFTYKRRVFQRVEDGVYCRNSKFHKVGEKRYRIVSRIESVTVPYTPITAVDFRHLVRLYWQGFDQDKTGFKSFEEDCKYGIAKEGKYLGKVNSFAAVVYVAKYCCKDIRLKLKEFDIKKLLSLKIRNELKQSFEFHKDFFDNVIRVLYQVPSIEGKFDLSAGELCASILSDLHYFFQSLPDCKDTDMFPNETFVKCVKLICKQEKLWKYYNEFLNNRIDILVNDYICEWRNRYCNKCRISQGVGLFALSTIKDYLNPMVEFPTKDGVIMRNLCQYYYRKLFTTILIPTFKDFFGNYHLSEPVRCLNADGINFKVSKLPDLITKKKVEVKKNVNLLFEDESLYDLMVNSDVNTSVFMDYETFLYKMNQFKFENIDVYERYAIYKLVYEDRFFSVLPQGLDSVPAQPALDYFSDYRRFLVPSVYSVSRSDLFLDNFLENIPENMLPYSEHSYFLRFLGVFGVFDTITDYLFVQKDEQREKEFNERKALKSFHVKQNLSIL